MILFVVGDTHGCHDKLISLIAKFRHYAEGWSHRFIFLGDYIDRGPDSRAVIELLNEFHTTASPSPILLRGNHEQMLLDALHDATAELHCFMNGGDATLESYGVSSAASLPPAHLAFFEKTQLAFDDGFRFFAHAGVNPDRALADQDPNDLLWIREPFLSSRKNFGRRIVHGHTPIQSGQPDVLPNRINLDTAAAYGGPLTAAIFVDDSEDPVGFVQAA